MNTKISRDPGWGVRVHAASRLSFTLIDMNGEYGRRNGIAALSICSPAIRAKLIPATQFEVILDEYSITHQVAIENFMEELQQIFGNRRPARISIEQGIPANTGFGSKTTTLMALGKAYAIFSGREVSIETLAKIAKRGGTSGASVNLIDRGGFLVDGGHANPDDFYEDPHKYLVPSRFAEVNKIPPVLINLKFPPWPILIVIGVGSNVQGNTELSWFRKTVPIPLEEARKTAHIVLMQLAPSIAEANYETFCRAINTITYDTYFKQQQIANQSDAVQSLISEASKQNDLDAFGMSSMGPMCYAFTRWPDNAVRWLNKKKSEGVVSDFWFTNVQNYPAVVSSIPGNQ